MHEKPSIQTQTFIPFMRDVVRCEGALRELNLMWRLIESSAKMNCPQEAHNILPMMTATREGFQKLEADLVQSLVAESMHQVMAELSTKARHVIDIVVRNLYERTADVGFLATDQELCRFVAGLESDAPAIQQRLREYREKYTVYEDIMLLDCEGTVLAQIDEAHPVAATQDALLAQTLDCSSYVETFRATDLRPGKRHALIYSHRMLHPTTGVPVGVLCLCFAFDGEMQGIFHARSQVENFRSIALLLDGEHRVIASAAPHWITLGTLVPVNEAATPELFIHGGRAYLVQTVTTAGYQSYPGPAGWLGQVMVPVELAFSSQSDQVLSQLEPGVAHGLLSHAQKFCPPLHAIVTAADTIRRVVWNGQVMSSGQQQTVRLKAVLEQIGETGARTNEMFSASIRDLYGTVLRSHTRDGEFLSQLLVDLLDRNLYERANDCRWWALTPELRDLLVNVLLGIHDSQDAARVQGILEHINSLYTVYTRLMVYDRTGRILASSHPLLDDGTSVLGLQIEADTLDAVFSLRDTQSYHVTPWRVSTHYDGRPTFVYHAAIRSPSDVEQIVGGIGIVFDAAREFEAMLRGLLSTKPNTHCVFTDRDGIVLSSTDPRTLTGTLLPVPKEMLDVEPGHSQSCAMVYADEYCIVASAASHGYREFKVSDGYRNDVIAVSVRAFGAQQSSAIEIARRQHTSTLKNDAAIVNGREMATFFVGNDLFALDTTCVMQALSAHDIAAVSAARMPYCVGTVGLRSHGQVHEYVWVFDLHEFMGFARSPISAQNQVIVACEGNTRIGLLVSELHSVVSFNASDIFPAPALGGAHEKPIVNELIKAHGGSTLVQCLNLPQLIKVLRGNISQPMMQELPQLRRAA